MKFHCEVTNEHGKDTSGLLELKLAKETEADQVIRRFSECMQLKQRSPGDIKLFEEPEQMEELKLTLPFLRNTTHIFVQCIKIFLWFLRLSESII